MKFFFIKIGILMVKRWNNKHRIWNEFTLYIILINNIWFQKLIDSFRWIDIPKTPYRSRFMTRFCHIKLYMYVLTTYYTYRYSSYELLDFPCFFLMLLLLLSELDRSNVFNFMAQFFHFSCQIWFLFCFFFTVQC